MRRLKNKVFKTEQVIESPSAPPANDYDYDSEIDDVLELFEIIYNAHLLMCPFYPEGRY